MVCHKDSDTMYLSFDKLYMTTFRYVHEIDGHPHYLIKMCL